MMGCNIKKKEILAGLDLRSNASSDASNGKNCRRQALAVSPAQNDISSPLMKSFIKRNEKLQWLMEF